jgi:hypothetical protein
MEYNISETKLHYSLGISNYTHISSPMRRFIDMLNHLGFYSVNLDLDLNAISIDIKNINKKISKYKKLSNGYDLLRFIKTNPEKNVFKACLIDWNLDSNGKINSLLVLNQDQFKFIKVVNVELPQIESTSNLTKYMELDVELYYNSNNFKSTKFPFSIKII